MPGWPSEFSDTVLYGEREFIADRDVALRMLDGTRLDLLGNIYINGELLSISTDPGVSNDTISNAMLVNIPQNTVKGRVSAGSGDPEDLNTTQLTTLIKLFTDTLKGLVPPPGTPTGRYLKDNGNWESPSVFTLTTNGAVPNPSIVQGKFLKDDGTWDDVDPYTATTNGVVPAPGVVTGKYLSDNGWSDPPNTPRTFYGQQNWSTGNVGHTGLAFGSSACIGASVGDPCAVGITPFLGAGILISAAVNVNDAVNVSIYNISGSTLNNTATTIRVRVWKNEA